MRRPFKPICSNYLTILLLNGSEFTFYQNKWFDRGTEVKLHALLNNHDRNFDQSTNRLTERRTIGHREFFTLPINFK